MDEQTRCAFDWASNQNHRSVAATYARTLAEYVKSVGRIELDYPNWGGKFPTIAEAVACHTRNQDARISRLRANNERLRTELTNLIEAIEAGISSEMLVRCSLQNGSYLGSAKKALKAAVDQLADSMVAGTWQDGPAPKDGSWILGLFHGLPYVVGYNSWEVGGEMLPDGTGSPPDGHESGWCLAGDNLHVMDKDEPERWARIIPPNRHMPASWDGPGELG